VQNGQFGGEHGGDLNPKKDGKRARAVLMPRMKNPGRTLDIIP